MKALKVFLFGVLYGWFLKFAIDRIYRDNEIEAVRNENAPLKEQIRSLEARPATRAIGQGVAIQTRAAGDDLKVIKGIGPAIEKKLNEAGIRTFEALSQLTVEELEDILGSTKRLVKDGGNLIAQAEKLAGQKGQQ